MSKKKQIDRFKKIITLSLSFAVLFFFSVSAAHAQQQKRELNTIVLDAGHGGKDIGTPHFRMPLDEKDITLDIILKLGKILKDSMPHLKVIYTRKSDVFIPLEERHEIANRANADLFISVHVNSTAKKRIRVRNGYRYVGRGKHRHRVRRYKTVFRREATDAQGTMTFVLGLHRDPQKSKAIENYGENFREESGLLNPKDPTTKILIAQYTQTFLSRSIEFGSLVEGNLAKTGRNSYGVRQAGLEVLAGSAMPGVLIETGFINNPEDEKYLNSPKGQQAIAMAIYKAIKTYKAELKRKKHFSTAATNE